MDLHLATSQLRRSAQEQALRRELPAGAAADLTGLDDGELRQLTRRLAALRSSCGCRVGEIGTLLALVSTAVLWRLADWTSTPGGVVRGVAVSAALVLAGGVLGKLTGVASARLRYRRLVGLVTSRHDSWRTA